MEPSRLFAATCLSLALAACSSAEPAPPRPATAAAEIELGDLAPGPHTYGPFVPRIDMEVPADGDWVSYHLAADFFDVVTDTDDGPMGVMFLNPSAYLRAEDEEVSATTAEAALAVLEDHSGVTLSEPRQVQIGGMTGTQVDAEFTAGNTHIMRVEDGLIGIGPTNDFRVAYFDTDDGVLVVALIAPAGTMAEAERLTQPVVDSIVIG
jgi:hypothetical protein